MMGGLRAWQLLCYAMRSHQSEYIFRSLPDGVLEIVASGER
jgi:hypothetical protein